MALDRIGHPRNDYIDSETGTSRALLQCPTCSSRLCCSQTHERLLIFSGEGRNCGVVKYWPCNTSEAAWSRHRFPSPPSSRAAIWLWALFGPLHWRWICLIFPGVSIQSASWTKGQERAFSPLREKRTVKEKTEVWEEKKKKNQRSSFWCRSFSGSDRLTAKQARLLPAEHSAAPTETFTFSHLSCLKVYTEISQTYFSLIDLHWAA